ncbi:MAG: nuclear transport factor 2 family protein [Deltaproteobacteria bacterium]|nr:nuclear transport factor 2 family protein [Deltaproteobacteria bacterium]
MERARSPKEIVLEFYRLALEKVDPKAAFEAYATSDFVEHSADIPEGTRQAAVDFLAGLIQRFPAPKWQVVRSAAEGDLVFLHVHVTPAQGERGVAIVEIFRVENSKIVEHWDVIQPVPEKPVNAPSMF